MVLCCSTGSGLVSCAPQGSCLSPREPNAVARHSHLSNSPRLLLAFPFRDFGLIVTVAPPQSSSTVLAGSLHCIPPAGAYSTITTLPMASALPPHRAPPLLLSPALPVAIICHLHAATLLSSPSGPIIRCFLQHSACFLLVATRSDRPLLPSKTPYLPPMAAS